MELRPARGVGPAAIPPDVLDRLVDEPLFGALTPAERERLFIDAEYRLVNPQQLLTPEVDSDAKQHVAPLPAFFLVEGMAKVHAEIQGIDQILNYLDRREIFWASGYSEAERASIALTSMSPVAVLVLSDDAVQTAVTNNPAFRASVEADVRTAAERRKQYFVGASRERISSFVVGERLLPTNRVKILRHDLCVECDACYEACADRHGVSRLWPSDVRLGVVSIPDNCHNCYYPTCMDACKFDVLKYSGDEAELIVSHDCVGCQQCARACSYDSITMVPFDAINRAYLRERDDDARGGRMYAVKCDNCADYDNLACISACPTGALFQVEGAKLLDLLINLDEKGTDSAALDELNPGPLPFVKKLSWLFFWVVTLFASWEILAHYFAPELTLTMVLHTAGLIDYSIDPDTPPIYRYVAGNDLSYLYGMLAVTLALFGQFYRVRKWFGGWGGDMRLWLQFHIITSCLGAMFAFWHLAFEIVNLSAIAWWSFIVCVVSGFIGMYLHTFVPKNIAGRELGLESLNKEFVRVTREIKGFYANKREAKLAAAGAPGGGHTTMTRLQDLKDLGSGTEAEFLTGVFKLLVADLASLRDRDTVHRAAARRAGVSGDRARTLEGLIRRRARLESGVRLYEKIRYYTRQWYRIHRAFSYIFFVSVTLHIIFVVFFPGSF
jgi:Fe-S-cluster-containing hydrogenase component 2